MRHAVSPTCAPLSRHCSAMSSRAHVELFFDCVSPYTHISLSLWARYTKAWPVTLQLRPFFLGGVMQATGNRPPATLPSRGVFLEQDLRRSAALHDVAMLETPSNFFSAPLQKSAIKVARLMCAAQLEGVGGAKLLDLAVAASGCIHAEPAFRAESELAIEDALLTRACSQVGLEAQTLLELAQGEAAKQALRKNTEDAIERGAFGSPTAFVSVPGGGEEQMFFGSDRMEQLAFHLGLPYEGGAPKARL